MGILDFSFKNKDEIYEVMHCIEVDNIKHFQTNKGSVIRDVYNRLQNIIEEIDRYEEECIRESMGTNPNE